MDSLNRQCRILLVDDIKINVELLFEVLKNDYLLSVAYDGIRAIELAHEEKPDLILLDVVMPGMNGFEVCHFLQQDPTTKSIPVIFLTGMDDPKHIEKGFRVGAVDYVTKPFDLTEVRIRIKNHLDLKIAQESLRAQNVLLEEKIKEQEISIDLAKNILHFINGSPRRHIGLDDTKRLFVTVFSEACHLEGGDHCFVRTFRTLHGHGQKTVISLKDQSGHAVNCILRCIKTDLMHNALLLGQPQMSLVRSITALNKNICQSGLFMEDDFFTSLTAEIEHDGLLLHYVSTGHPPFLLIRNKEVTLAGTNDLEGSNLPVGVEEGLSFGAGRLQLQTQDKLLFFTDGLLELPSKLKKEAFSAVRLRNIVQDVVKKHGDPPVSSIIDFLLEALVKTSADEISDGGLRSAISDDIMVVGLEIEEGPFQERKFRPQRREEIDQIVTEIYTDLEQELMRRKFEGPELRICLVLMEALLNAWRHGNEEDANKDITVRWHIGNDLVIEVLDEGPGFPPTRIPDPTVRPNILKPDGRGIYIMREFADEVRWEDSGRRLIVCFKKRCSSKGAKKGKGRQLYRQDLWQMIRPSAL